MKKAFSIFLILMLTLSLFPITAFAESDVDYNRLWNEKNKFEQNIEISYGQDGVYSLSYGYEPCFILFTEQRNKLTYQVISSNDNSVKGFRLSDYWDEKGLNDGILVS